MNYSTSFCRTLVNIPILSIITKRQCFGILNCSIFLITSFVSLKHVWAKSKIGHHCDGRNFFFQLSFLSSQKPRHLYHIDKQPLHSAETPVRCRHDQTRYRGNTFKSEEFCSKIPSVAKIHFWLSCFPSCVILHREYTAQQSNQHTSIIEGKKSHNLTHCYGNTIFKMRRTEKIEQPIPSVALTNCVAIATRSTVAIPFLPVMKAHQPFILKTHSWCPT